MGACRTHHPVSPSWLSDTTYKAPATVRGRVHLLPWVHVPRCGRRRWHQVVATQAAPCTGLTHTVGVCRGTRVVLPAIVRRTRVGWRWVCVRHCLCVTLRGRTDTCPRRRRECRNRARYRVKVARQVSRRILPGVEDRARGESTCDKIACPLVAHRRSRPDLDDVILL